MTERKRWPNKPPKNAPCDAGRGVEYRSGHPVVVMCKNLAVETVVGRMGFETWLCKECADDLVAKGKVQRNPRASVAQG